MREVQKPMIEKGGINGNVANNIHYDKTLRGIYMQTRKKFSNKTMHAHHINNYYEMFSFANRFMKLLPFV